MKTISSYCPFNDFEIILKVSVKVFGSISWKGARFSLQPCPVISLKLGKGAPQ
jgi:hypothetical protein